MRLITTLKGVVCQLDALSRAQQARPGRCGCWLLYSIKFATLRGPDDSLTTSMVVVVGQAMVLRIYDLHVTSCGGGLMKKGDRFSLSLDGRGCAHNFFAAMLQGDPPFYRQAAPPISPI